LGCLAADGGETASGSGSFLADIFGSDEGAGPALVRVAG